MYNHAPPDYRCPFCPVAAGLEVEYCYTNADDVVLRTAQVTGFISSHWWPRIQGHVILIPNAHHESIYDLPDDYGAAIFKASRLVALALKTAYGCDWSFDAPAQRTGRNAGSVALSLPPVPALFRRWALPTHG